MSTDRPHDDAVTAMIARVMMATKQMQAVRKAADNERLRVALASEVTDSWHAVSADYGRFRFLVTTTDFEVVDYSARIHGTPEHISGREPFATALRVVGEWAAERRGLWAPEQKEVK